MKNYQKQEVDHIRRDFLRTVNANLLKTKDFEQYQESIMSNRGVECKIFPFHYLLISKK